jgi:hypothetical protein
MNGNQSKAGRLFGQLRDRNAARRQSISGASAAAGAGNPAADPATGAMPHAGGPTRQSRHLREDVLAIVAIELLNGDAPSLEPAGLDHLTHCARCTARLEGLQQALAADRQDTSAVADAHFSEARLDGQRDAILDRLVRERAQARVLAFPTTPAPWMARRDRPAMRWLAAAAAAGLLIGLGAGQMVFTGQPFQAQSFQANGALRFRDAGSPSATSTWTPARWLSRVHSRPVGATVTTAEGRVEQLSPAAEEEFLSEMESALNNRRIAALQALDDLTPRAHDVPRRRK